MFQFNAAIIIAGAIERTSRDKFHQVLGLEAMVDPRSSSKFIFYHKVILGLLPSLRKKVSVLGVIIDRIFPAFSRIRTEYGSEYGEMRENADQNKFKYRHFLRSVSYLQKHLSSYSNE